MLKKKPLVLTISFSKDMPPNTFSVNSREGTDCRPVTVRSDPRKSSLKFECQTKVSSIIDVPDRVFLLHVQPKSRLPSCPVPTSWRRRWVQVCDLQMGTIGLLMRFTEVRLMTAWSSSSICSARVIEPRKKKLVRNAETGMCLPCA